MIGLQHRKPEKRKAHPEDKDTGQNLKNRKRDSDRTYPTRRYKCHTPCSNARDSDETCQSGGFKAHRHHGYGSGQTDVHLPGNYQKKDGASARPDRDASNEQDGIAQVSGLRDIPWCRSVRITLAVGMRMMVLMYVSRASASGQCKCASPDQEQSNTGDGEVACGR